MKTWHFPASRLHGRECFTRSRSRSKQSRYGSASSPTALLPAPEGRVAPGARLVERAASRSSRPRILPPTRASTPECALRTPAARSTTPTGPGTVTGGAVGWISIGVSVTGVSVTTSGYDRGAPPDPDPCLDLSRSIASRSVQTGFRRSWRGPRLRARRARRRDGPGGPGRASTTRSRGRPRGRSGPRRGRLRARRRSRA